MAMNKCMFQGYLYFKDNNGQQLQSGLLQQYGQNKLVKFTLSNSKVGKNADGSKKDPNWIDCVAWNSLAERICTMKNQDGSFMFGRGVPVIIEARYDQTKFQAKNNQGQPLTDQNTGKPIMRTSHDFVVTDMHLQLLSGNNGGQAQAPVQYQQPAAAPAPAPAQYQQQAPAQYQQAPAPAPAPTQYQQPAAQPQAPVQYQQPAAAPAPAPNPAPVTPSAGGIGAADDLPF